MQTELHGVHPATYHQDFFMLSPLVLPESVRRFRFLFFARTPLPRAAALGFLPFLLFFLLDLDLFLLRT